MATGEPQPQEHITHQSKLRRLCFSYEGSLLQGSMVGLPATEPVLLPRAEGQKLWDVHYSRSLLGGRGWSAASSHQALGNGSRCPLNICLSSHPPAALPNIPPSRKKTPFGIPLASESFSVGETICLRSLSLPPWLSLWVPAISCYFKRLLRNALLSVQRLSCVI